MIESKKISVKGVEIVVAYTLDIEKGSRDTPGSSDLTIEHAYGDICHSLDNGVTMEEIKEELKCHIDN